MAYQFPPLHGVFGRVFLVLAAWGITITIFSSDQKAFGDLIAHSSRSAFDLAGSPFVSVNDLESFSIGNVPSGGSLGGMTFNYSLGSVSLKVVNSLATTSGVKSLGTDDRDLLADGDILNISFAPQKGLGVYVLSSDALLDGDVRLTVGSTVAPLVASSTQVNLGGGRFAWFLGVQSDDGTTFTNASLTTHGGGGAFYYNLDDFVTVAAIPEPSSVCLIAFAALSCCRYRSRLVVNRN